MWKVKEIKEQRDVPQYFDTKLSDSGPYLFFRLIFLKHEPC